MIRYTARGITIGEVWFDEPVEQPKPDVIFYRHSRARAASRPATATYSFVTDLTAERDAIYAGFGKHCQAEIQRAQREPGLVVEAARLPRSPDEVEQMLAFHRRFANGRGIPPADCRQVRAAAAANRLLLSVVTVDGEPVVWHSYLASHGQFARGLQSASAADKSDSKARRTVSRANRLLHWADMVALQEAGFTTLDWGGRFADECEPHKKGINDFKRDFGARPVEYTEWTEPTSLRGHAYLALRPVVGRVRAALQTSLLLPFLASTPVDGKGVA